MPLEERFTARCPTVQRRHVLSVQLPGGLLCRVPKRVDGRPCSPVRTQQSDHRQHASHARQLERRLAGVGDDAHVGMGLQQQPCALHVARGTCLHQGREALFGAPVGIPAAVLEQLPQLF
eukprot:2533866-Prymnesium_polylepis.2